MEHICNSPESQLLTNSTFLESLQSMTDCSFNFYQLVLNCLFIYLICILLIYRVYCLPKCSPTSSSRFAKFIRARKEANTSSALNSGTSGVGIAGGYSRTPTSAAAAASYNLNRANLPKRRRNSKSTCSNATNNSDSVFECNLRTISESNNYNYDEDDEDVIGGRYDVDYNYDDDDDLNLKHDILKDQSRQLLKHHIIIWIFSFIFILIVCIQFAENLIVFLTIAHNGGQVERELINNNKTSLNGSGGATESAVLTAASITTIHYLRMFSTLSSIITLFFTLLLFQHIETCRELKYLWINLSYYFITATFGSIYFYFYFYVVQLDFLQLKISSNIGLVLMGLVLFGIVFHTFLVERNVVKALAESTLVNVKYLHYHTSLLSRLVFFWFTEILHIGYKRPLEGEDLGLLPPEDKTQFQFKRFNEIYQAERDKCEIAAPKKEFSLWKCLFKTLGSSLAISGVFRLLADLTGFVAPLGIRTIVKYVGSNATTTVASDEHGSLFLDHMSITAIFSNGYVMAFVILLSAILQSTFSQCSTFLVNSEGIHIKVALQALIYKKSLTLSPTKSSSSSSSLTSPDESSSNNKKGGTVTDSSASSMKKRAEDAENNSVQDSQSSGFDSGSILNILSEDTNNIMMFFWMVNYIWAIPLKLSILMGLLYLQLGFSALIGAGICILIMIPLQFYLGKKMSCNSKELMEKCDERLRSISEILQGMKLLKVQGWELLFGKQIIEIREKELKNLDKDLLYRSIMTFLTHISSVLVTVVTFGLYSYIETEKLDPAKVFAGLALFNQLTVPLFIFPITVPVVIDALVSAKRVREFLLMPEAVSYTKCEDEATDSETNYSDEKKSQEQQQQQQLILNILNSNSNKAPQPPSPSCLKPPKPKNSDVDASTDSVFAPIAEDDEEEEEDDDEDDAYQTEDDGLDETTDDDFGIGLSDVADKVKEVPKRPAMEELTKHVTIQSSHSSMDVESSTASSFDAPSTKLDVEEGDSIITISHGEFSWEADRHDQTLRGIDAKIPVNKLTIIVGPIGSGKSSFISALMGEMKKISGEVQWKSNPRIAYAAQKPWILNATVKENILFGKNFKSRRYKKVIDACSLQPDIDMLPAGENTEIGEKGINLSGGQRQRISIARALYSNAHVVILDDPLSALDVEVAQQVFNSGIRRFLIKSQRTVILVTHHLPVLPHAHQIIAMENGKIRAQGTYKEIESSDPKLYSEWRRIMTNQKEELKKGAKSGKEMWKLLKNVQKVTKTLKVSQLKTPAQTEEEKNLEGYKKRKEVFAYHKTLSHEYRPGDECYYEDIMASLLCHRQISRQSKESRTSTSSATMKTHPPVSRMTSLQVESKTGGRSPTPHMKVHRLQSLPVDEETKNFGAGGTQPIPLLRPRSGTNDSAMAAFNAKVRRKFFSKKQASSTTSSSVTEMERLPPSQRLVSTISGDPEDLTDDEGDEDALLMSSRESSQDEREYGLIPIRVYLRYIEACGYFLSSFYIFIAIGYEVVHVYTNFWLKEWSDEVGRSPAYQYDDVMSHYFTIYVLLSIITIIVSLTSNIIGKRAGANSRKKLHSQMFNCIIRCPVRFFDITPIGRILNRFASDVAVVDRKLCVSVQRFLQFVFLCISAIVVNAIVNPWFLIVAIPIVIIYYGLQRFYRFSSRELHRIEAISRGPIFSHFHETLEGLSTIRAFGVQSRFTNQMLATIDINNTAAMFINCGNRWLSISLDYLGSVIVFLATFVSMISSHLHPDVVTPSMVGLAINYTLLVPVYLNHVVKFLAEVEMFMNSVDRIDRFSKQEIEEYGDENSSVVPKDWPTKGEVRFDHVSVRYSSTGPNIIQNLNVQIESEQKVGLCGRSGSGKSSLLMALFRISEISEGKIEIDGIDVKKIPLLKLRSGIAIIPQENILFSGTIRFNLDPLNTIKDTDIWLALEQCQMKQTIQQMPGQLDAEIKDGGSGFSAGQKQLLGLARAILHKTKLIIMDEATSSVDLATERTLLQVVSDVFKDSTVLTIAHRLGTITGGDRVLVLDGGQLVEDGSPKDLMSRPLGIFATMLKSSNEQQ